MFALINFKKNKCDICKKVHYYITYKHRVIVSQSKKELIRNFPSGWLVGYYQSDRNDLLEKKTMTCEDFFKEQEKENESCG